MPPVLLTPQNGRRLLHPSHVRRNEMIAITPPKIFSKEVAQNRAPHLPRQQPPSAPEIVLRQISRDEARMNFHFSHALPQGASAHAALTRGPPICLGRAGDLCALASSKGRAM